MGKIEFSKYHGQGNDFVIIDAIGRSLSLEEGKIRHICDRHFGIGADGLILVKDSVDHDFYMDYYNMDGTRAEMCGNGIRCMAAFIFDRSLSRKNSLKIDTMAGSKTVDLNIAGGLPGNICVDMGPPVFDPEQIPVNLGREQTFNHKLQVENRVFNINCISMGNPHCVIFLDDHEDLQSIPIDIWGPLLEKHDLFPRNTNVEFVKVLEGGGIEMRIWERGVGETLACGTGACAAGVCTIKLDGGSKSAVDVSVPGGRLEVGWESPSGNVFLKGRVKHVFDGLYFPEQDMDL
jgi:diaminopimelate epimerase